MLQIVLIMDIFCYVTKVLFVFSVFMYYFQYTGITAC
jgi:hypothetical protein